MTKQTSNTYRLEICANSYQSAVNAQNSGAHRIELCAGLWEAGITPSFATIKKSCALDIDVFVLIRPRGGDFVYTAHEFEILKTDIENCKNLGVDGIVSGVLRTDNTIDLERTQALVELAKPLPFTFHRAFDLIEDQEEAIEQLISIGVKRILTSGGKASAPEAFEQLKKLVKKSNDKITILAGGGINSQNIETLLDSGCKEFHMTASTVIQSKAKAATITLNGCKSIPEQNYKVSDASEIRKVLQLITPNYSHHND